MAKEKTMRRHYKDVFKRMDRFWHGVLFVCVCISLLLATLKCTTDDFYVGKTREELEKEMFRVDSLIMDLKYSLDSTSIDFEKFYFDAQKINNGHNG